MNELEQAFRDALRRADRIEIPVPSIDPAEISGRGRFPWRSVLAAAAAVVVVAGVGIVWVLAGRGPGAALPGPVGPSEAAGATVEVDLFSGQVNPVVDLPASVTDELYALLDKYADAAPHTDPREPVLGFRGFLVTPVDESRPVLRIQPESVRFGPVHDYRTFQDSDQVFYKFVLDAVRGSLSEDVLKALDESTQPVPPDQSETPLPEESPSSTNRTYDTATWVLLEPVTPESTSLVIGVTRLGCANGETGKVFPAVVEYTEDQILIRVDVEAWNDEPADCQGNEEVLFSVQLDEPIGQRQLVDVACLSGEAQGTTFCSGGAVRWQP